MYIKERFDISLQLESKVNDVCSSANIRESDLVERASQVAYAIMMQTKAGRHFLADDMRIDLPKAQEVVFPEMAPLQVHIYANAAEALRSVSQRCGISKQAVLSWGMECIEILELALSWGPLFTDGPQGREPFSPVLIKN